MGELANKMAKAQQPAPRDTVRDMLMGLRPQLEVALPRHVDPDRFLRIALTAVRTNPKLLDCEPMSLLGAVMTAGQLGLELDARGLAYLVPYGRECTLIVGYQGQMELARRSGAVTKIWPTSVHENDNIRVVAGLHPDIPHWWDPLTDRGELIGVYASAHLREAEPMFEYVTLAEARRVRDRSPAAKAKGSPWASDFEAMCWKTAIHRLCKWLPQTPELGIANSVDYQPMRAWSPDDGPVLDPNPQPEPVDPEPEPQPADA